MDVAQAAPFIQAMTYEPGLVDYADFPRTDSPVWVLGKAYSAIHDLEELKHDIVSRIWCTYRKNFTPIGGIGPTGDTGWGCMLRCGQMMFAQALVCRHLGRDWRWQSEKYDPKYHEIMRMFQDKKGSCYSIHQIASMGASEGKGIGEWFGPNTVAQVLRKLAIYDEWSRVAVHVALDNTIIIDDIYKLCQFDYGNTRRVSPHKSTHGSNKRSGKSETIEDCDKAQTNGGISDTVWKPLVLFIPLRLGLSEINPVYTNSLKTCLTLKQSIGIIGGKPNHAYYFMGCVDDELLYLDPHTTQESVNLDTIEPQKDQDTSYHCPMASRMDIQQLDPSIAVGFYCHTEEDFLDLCTTIREEVINVVKTPMFEIHQHRPRHWPPYEPYRPNVTVKVKASPERLYDTDDEFELL